MNKLFTSSLALLACLMPVSSVVAQQEDYFKKYGSKVSVVAQLGARAQPMQFIGIDPKIGKLFCSIPGVGEVNYELRALQQQVKSFDYTWPKDTRNALIFALDEQYDKIPETIMAQKVRPIMYPLLHYLEVPNKHFDVHEQCLTFVKLLIAKKQYPEALVLL